MTPEHREIVEQMHSSSAVLRRAVEAREVLTRRLLCGFDNLVHRVRADRLVERVEEGRTGLDHLEKQLRISFVLRPFQLLARLPKRLQFPGERGDGSSIGTALARKVELPGDERLK